MVEKREQVFVSSTFKDLVEERRAVIQTLLEADCIPSGMELFPASNDEKFDLIKRVIDLCDYYVVIVGGRYGSVDAAEQLSYTEMEFNYAVEQQKPVMGFLHGDPGKIPGEKLDLAPELRVKLDEFRATLETRMVKYWLQPTDLSGQVALALMQTRKTHPAEGWVRAGQAMTPEIKSELVELRAKVRELQAELGAEQQEHRAVDRAQLDQGNDLVKIACVLTYHWQSTIDKGRDSPSSRMRSTHAVKSTWDEILRHLGPDMMDEATEWTMDESLGVLCLTLSRRELLIEDDGSEVQGTPEGSETVGAIYEAEIAPESFNDVKVQLNALGLIEPGTRRRLASDQNAYWKLTKVGHRQVLELRAIRRGDAVSEPPGAPT